jgi:hypothetical protein
MVENRDHIHRCNEQMDFKEIETSRMCSGYVHDDPERLCAKRVGRHPAG